MRNVKKQRREDRTGINTHYNYDKMTAMFSACIYTCRCTLKSIVQAFIQKKLTGGRKSTFQKNGRLGDYPYLGGSAKLFCLETVVHRILIELFIKY